MNKIISYTAAVVLSVFLYAENGRTHCEIPCGIYDDEMRINLVSEHIRTIEKSMKQIKQLESNPKRDGDHQLVRWIMNKELHANELQGIVAQYFMTQRIKPDSKNYEKKLSTLHQMLLAAMKCKQTTDLRQVERLNTLVNDFKKLYF